MGTFARFWSQPWHLKCLTALLALWCLWSLFHVTYALLDAPAEMGFSLLDYYIFLAMPLLMAVSVLLLLLKTRWVTLPLALLPVAYWMAAVRLFPDQLSPAGRTIDWTYLSIFPLTFKIGLLFFTLCIVYSLFLAKWGHLK